MPRNFLSGGYDRWEAGKHCVSDAEGSRRALQYSLILTLHFNRRMFSGKVGLEIYHLVYKIGKCVFPAIFLRFWKNLFNVTCMVLKDLCDIQEFVSLIMTVSV